MPIWTQHIMTFLYSFKKGITWIIKTLVIIDSLANGLQIVSSLSPLFLDYLLHFIINAIGNDNFCMHGPILTFLRFSSNFCCWDKCARIVPSKHCACSRSSSQYLLICVSLALIRADSPVVTNWAKDWASSSNSVMLLILLSISWIVT